MKQSIGFNQFCDAFRDTDRNDNFSYQGKRALYDFLEQMDEDGGTEYELDVVGLCCEFTEYADLDEFQGNYSADEYPTYESIADHTCLVMVDDTAFIIQDF